MVLTLMVLTAIFAIEVMWLVNLPRLGQGGN